LIPEGSYWFWVLISVLIAAAVQKLYWTALTWSFSVGPLFANGAIRTLDQFIGVYLGLETLPRDVAAAVLEQVPPSEFWLFVLGVAMPLILALLLYLRWSFLYWMAVGLACLNMVYALIQMLMSWCPMAWLAFGISLVPVVVLWLIQGDFLVKRERLLCRPDVGARTHSEFYARGREYARRKMWALAAIHFRRAIGSAPNVLAYHLSLATAYIGLKRYQRARAALREAHRLAPDHPDVRALSELIAQRESKGV